MKKVVVLLSLVLMVLVIIAPGNAEASEPQCWGQATAVFAQMGVMGEHASQEATPRIGLANLADALADAGIIPEGTMEALGVFVSSALNLSIDACLP
jgi:hypothetical protein